MTLRRKEPCSLLVFVFGEARARETSMILRFGEHEPRARFKGDDGHGNAFAAI